MQAQNASLFLGLIPNPQTNQPEVNLDLARMFIDQLAMIREKTRGNLSTEETNVLRNALTNLQMAYVEVSQGGGEPPASPTSRLRPQRRAIPAARRRQSAAAAAAATPMQAARAKNVSARVTAARGQFAVALNTRTAVDAPERTAVSSSLIYGDRAGRLGRVASPLLFILGPCVIESEDFLWDTAGGSRKSATDRRVNSCSKASYDKANRTSGKSFRGMPAREGCQLLAAVGRELGVAVTTDVHSPAEAEIAAEWIDVLQIPAFLCRQTDLIQAAARTGRVVNVKKGQFLSPWDVRPIAEKLQAAGSTKFFFTERGVTFGYQNLVADMRSLYWMRQAGYRGVFRRHAFRPAARRGRRPHGRRRRTRARAGPRRGGDGLRRRVHGGARGPGQSAVGRPEPNSPSTTRRGLLATLQRIHEAAHA